MAVVNAIGLLKDSPLRNTGRMLLLEDPTIEA